MAKDFKKFTAYDELHGTVLTTTSLYEFTDTEMQEHDERIRKELIAKIIDLAEKASFDTDLLDSGIDRKVIYYDDFLEIFAQLEK